MRRLLTMLLAVACIGYVINLGAASIWDANEAFYVETPREMIESGDYVTPTFDYEPRVNKPVLSYWVVALLYRVFGVSVGVQRGAIAAAALIMIACVFLLARAASGAPAAPLLAAAGLAANPRFFMFARRILIDVGVTMLMTVTLTCFAMAERDPAHRRRWLLGMYVAVGLGVLTKGPVAAALPALVFLIYLAVHRELRRVREMMLPEGLVIVAAIVAPWYIALYRESGWANIVSFVVGENFERYTSVIGPQSRDVWFYLPVILTDGLPWSLCLPGVIVAWLRDRRTPDAGTRIRTLLLLWTGVIVLVFSFSQTKQDLYIFPIVAAVTALGADVVARALGGSERPAWVNGALWAAAIALIAAGGGVLYLFARAGAVYMLGGARVVATLWIVGGGVVAVFLIWRRLHCAVIAALVVPIAFNWILMLRVLPSFERYKPVVPLSRTFLERAHPDDLLVHYDVALPSMVFYTRRPIKMLFGPELGLADLQATLTSGRQVFVVIDESKYDAIKTQMGVPTCVAARQLTSDVRLRELLAGQPPPAVLLVTTRCT
jgi:4-amino-4-deoxy-L-arabinose transferase-like glycosyltransferase